MTSFLDKFKYAIRGLLHLCKDHSVQYQLFGFLVVLIVFAFLNLTVIEWLLILIACAMVVISEMINTVIERFLDFVEPNHNQKIEKLKDMGAGMVLFTCIIAGVIGIVMLLYKLF